MVVQKGAAVNLGPDSLLLTKGGMQAMIRVVVRVPGTATQSCAPGGRSGDIMREMRAE